MTKNDWNSIGLGYFLAQFLYWTIELFYAAGNCMIELFFMLCSFGLMIYFLIIAISREIEVRQKNKEDDHGRLE